jgi:subtilisin family serine protease
MNLQAIPRVAILVSATAILSVHLAAAQTVLQGHILWSIAHEGCKAYSGNTLNPPEIMRACFLAKESRNEQATKLIRDQSTDELAEKIKQSLPIAYDQYQIPAQFEWVLSHEHQLELFRELGRTGHYRRLRSIYYQLQQHNPNAKNVLSAVSDAQIQELLDRRRLVVAIKSDTSYDALKAIDSMTIPEVTTTRLQTTLASLLTQVYGSANENVTRLILERNHDLISQPKGISPADLHIPLGTTIVLPSIGHVGTIDSLALQPISKGESCATCEIINPNLMTIVDLRQNGTSLEPEIFGHIENPVGTLQSVEQPTAADYGWYLDLLGLDSIEPGDLKLTSQVQVAVVDSGVETSHPDLRASFWSTPSALADSRWPAGAHGYDFIQRTSVLSDQSAVSHGTHVSGLVVGAQVSKWKPNIGNALTNNIRLVELKITGSQNLVDSGTVQNAILAGVGKGVRIFNCSFELANESEMLKAYMKDRTANTLFIVAAGNNGAGVNKGANLDGNAFRQETFKDSSVPLADVILVAALGRNGKLAPFSNYGQKTVTVAAPGTDISSTIHGRGYGLMDGTSQAAPFVTLTAAILASELPSMSLPEIHQRITDTCDWVDDLKPFVRDGCRLNIQKATTTNADLLQLKSGVILKGTVSSLQFAIPGTGSSSIGHKLERIWFDNGDRMTIVTTDARTTIPATPTSMITITLAKPSACPGHLTGSTCTLPVSLIRDIVFRASSM